MPMMRLGPFIFSIPTFSYEGLNKKVSARAESQPVIGAPPPTHLLGPNADTMDLTCTFFPYHLNGAGLLQLRAMQEAAKLQTPLMMVNIGGLVFGRWVIVGIDEAQTFIHPRTGAPQKIDVGISLLEYVGGRGSDGFRIGFF